MKCQSDAVADEMRQLRETAGQIFRAFNADGIAGEKFVNVLEINLELRKRFEAPS